MSHSDRRDQHDHSPAPTGPKVWLFVAVVLGLAVLLLLLIAK